MVRAVAGEQCGTHMRPDQADAHDRQQHHAAHLRGDGVGSEHRDQRAREAADGREQGIEGEMVQLYREEHHASSDPCDDQADIFLPRRVYDPPRVILQHEMVGTSSRNSPDPVFTAPLGSHVSGDARH